MPFHPINFLAAQLEKPQRFMPDNLGQELANAYKLYQMPGAFAQGRETQDLANAFKRMQMQEAEEMAPFKRALTEAQTKKLEREAQSPFGAQYNLQGPARQAWDLRLLKETLGKDSEEYKLAQKLMEASQSRGFGSAPIRMQANVIENVQRDNPNFSEQQAQQATARLLDGESTLLDGTPINIGGLTRQGLNSLMKYSTDAAQRNALVSGHQAEAEIDVMVPYIKEGIAPYGDTYFGKSPELMADTLKAKSGDKAASKRIGEFIAARTLQLESYQLQQRMQTGKVTVAATKELIERGVATIGGDFNSLTNESQQVAIDTVQEAVQKAFEARKKAGIGTWEATRKQEKQQKEEFTDYIRDPKTGKLKKK